jgi:hypothetical protein
MSTTRQEHIDKTSPKYVQSPVINLLPKIFAEYPWFAARMQSPLRRKKKKNDDDIGEDPMRKTAEARRRRVARQQQ